MIFGERKKYWGALGRFPFLCMLLTSCVAGAPGIQPEVNSLVVAQRPQLASKVLLNDDELYGDNNKLLYWLDRGMVDQIRGEYRASIHSFAQAQRIYKQLYTESLTKKFATLLINDYSNDYRGEDYEYILTNVMQAINYALIGDIHEALVEARDMDGHFRLLKQIYDDKSGAYVDDGFVRMFMGILFQTAGGSLNLNDAYISYQKAIDEYQLQEQIIPSLLKENMLEVVEQFAPQELSQWMFELDERNFVSKEDRRQKGEVYVIEYAGFSPLKIPQSLAIPVDQQSIISISFPKMYDRFYENSSTYVYASSDGMKRYTEELVPMYNVANIARQMEERKKIWLRTKSIVRPILKYLIQREARQKMQEQHGDTAADILNLAFNAYNVYSEQADLRTWQTLPNEIRLGRLFVAPGNYTLNVQRMDSAGKLLDEEQRASIYVGAGETKFLLLRSYK